MQLMFRGINSIILDNKGRLSLPARYRDALLVAERTQLVATIDTEETCLLLYPALEWSAIEAKLQNLPSFNPIVRRIQRLLIGHATDLELDSNGRLLLPNILREYAQLDKKIVLIGQSNKFEIWNEMLWAKKRKQWLEEESLGKNQAPEAMQDFSL